MNWNKAQIAGRLVSDPETKSVGSSTVTRFKVASNRRFKKSDEYQEETLFILCDAWGNTGETIAKYLKKGDPIFVEGRLKLNEWEKDGKKNSMITLNVLDFQFTAPAGGASQHDRKVDRESDDIPF